eukprot:19009-Pelagomonas_calceolata.AAC.1
MEVGVFVPPQLLTEAPFFKYLLQRNVELAKHEGRCLVAAVERSKKRGPNNPAPAPAGAPETESADVDS